MVLMRVIPVLPRFKEDACFNRLVGLIAMHRTQREVRQPEGCRDAQNQKKANRHGSNGKEAAPGRGYWHVRFGNMKHEETPDSRFSTMG